ncbi:517_t:CDS:2, partial [Gigaspora margarita]
RNVMNEEQPVRDDNDNIAVDNGNLPKYANLPRDDNIFEPLPQNNTQSNNNSTTEHNPQCDSVQPSKNLLVTELIEVYAAKRKKDNSGKPVEVKNPLGIENAEVEADKKNKADRPTNYYQYPILFGDGGSAEYESKYNIRTIISDSPEYEKKGVK